MTGTISFDLTTDDGTHITGTASVTSMTVTAPQDTVGGDGEDTQGGGGQGETPPATTVAETFLATSKGDFWDTANPARCFSEETATIPAYQDSPCSVVKGERNAHTLRNGGAVITMPTYDAADGAIRFNGTIADKCSDMYPAMNVPLSSTFTLITMAKVVRGYWRAVMVDHSQQLGGENHYPVWFDLRVSQTQAAGWVQDHQYKQPNSTIPWLSGIGGCGTGWTLLEMWREVDGGPAYIKINGQTATVTPGEIVGNADVRIFEDENANDHDFSVRRPYLIDRCLSPAEREIVAAWVSGQPEVVQPPAGGVTFDPANNGGLILSNGNLTAEQNASTWVSVKGTSSVSSGIHSYTAHIDAAPHVIVGIGNAAAPIGNGLFCGYNNDACGYYLTDGAMLPGWAPVGTSGAGVTVKITVNANARTMEVRVDGVLKTTHDISHVAGAIFPMVSLHSAPGVTCDFSEWGA